MDLDLTIHCTHTAKKNAVVTKHTKVVHKIFTKMRTLIQCTDGELSHNNFNPTLVMVMREVRKYSRLTGIEKRWIVVQVMTLLLDLALPHLISHYTAEIIVTQLENAYTLGLHRYRRPHKHCVIF